MLSGQGRKRKLSGPEPGGKKRQPEVTQSEKRGGGKGGDELQNSSKTFQKCKQR